VEIYRSRDGRWSIERVVDRYVIYDEQADEPDREVWSCRTLAQLHQWMAANGLRPHDFEEVA
jgi:hypothetical protein